MANVVMVRLRQRFTSTTSYSSLLWWQQAFERDFYKYINTPFDFAPVDTTREVSKPSYSSANEAQSTNKLYGSPCMFVTDQGYPIRPEYGFAKMRPYVQQTLGPDGNGLAREAAVFKNTTGYADVYYLDRNIPQMALVRFLEMIDWPQRNLKWSAEKIDAYIPPYLFDRRLDDYTGTVAIEMLVRNHDFEIVCPWKPLPITSSLIHNQKYKRYCAMVCRLYLLEKLIVELKTQAMDHTTFEGLVSRLERRKPSVVENEGHDHSAENIDEDQMLYIHSAIKRASEWQDTMIGTILYMEETGRFSDAQIDYDFEESEEKLFLATYDTGLHWSFHLGELYNIAPLIPYNPYWESVGTKKSRGKRTHGRSTEVGAIGDMKGTPYENDPFVCVLAAIVKHGIPQPNQIRNADTATAEAMRKLMGRRSDEVDYAALYRTRLIGCIETMSDALNVHYRLYADEALSVRGKKLPDSVKQQRETMMEKCAVIVNNLLGFTDNRIGSDNKRLIRCSRTNRNKLKGALASKKFVSVVNIARAFLGMEKIKFKSE